MAVGTSDLISFLGLSCDDIFSAVVLSHLALLFSLTMEGNSTVFLESRKVFFLSKFMDPLFDPLVENGLV